MTHVIPNKPASFNWYRMWSRCRVPQGKEHIQAITNHYITAYCSGGGGAEDDLMEIQGTILTADRLFALLILGLGPIRISLAWLVVARDLSPVQRRQVAWRTVWIGMVISIGIMALGFSIRNILPQLEWIAIGVGLVLIVSTLNPRVPQIATATRLTQGRSIMEIAAFPLAVPTMINPAGMQTCLMF